MNIIKDQDKLDQFDTFEWENKNFGQWFKNMGFTQNEIDLIAYGHTKTIEVKHRNIFKNIMSFCTQGFPIDEDFNNDN